MSAQTHFVKVNHFSNVYHRDIESILNSVLSAGGQLVTYELDRHELIVTTQYTLEEYNVINPPKQYRERF